ncbi:hypothetical protein ALC60_14385 [Trachymyrmex zeteki]|uniref:Uncharacterized protein n=1 Tax=Mycetomoellerius zeteki TaxID=64791 RepID=A0A151WFM1_9HYME|nr:hypothetical protein ALC60_14385 [Trachymyrmex zeteki]
MLSKRMTAKSLEAKPEIQASKRTVKVMRELRPAAFVSVEDFICLVVDLLSGNMTFALADDVEDDDEEDDEGNCCCCDDNDDLFDNMFSRWPASVTSALKRATHQRGAFAICASKTPAVPCASRERGATNYQMSRCTPELGRLGHVERRLRVNHHFHRSNCEIRTRDTRVQQ